MDEKKQRGSHGKLGPGWMKQTLQVPRAQGEDFRSKASDVGPGGVKVLGTLGISLVNAMPEPVRIELSDYVNSATWRSPDGLKNDVLWKFFLNLLAVHGEELPEITYTKAVLKKKPEQDSKDT